MIAALTRLHLESASANATPLSGLSKAVLIDWGPVQAAVAEIVRHKDRWQVDREFTLRWATTAEDTDAINERGLQLKQELAKHQINCGHVVVSIPRRDAVLKLIDLPSVQPEMLADAIALQAESRGQSPENFVIDFLAQPCIDEGVAHVLMAAYRRQAIESIQTILQIADMQPLVIGIGELGLSMAMPITGEKQANLLVVAERELIHFVANRLGRTICSVALPMSPDAANFGPTLLAMLERLITALPAELVTEGIHSVFVAGPAAAQTAAAIGTQRTYTVQLLETPQTQSFRAYGLATAPLSPHSQINFHKPKQSHDARIAKRTANKRLLVRAGLMALLCFICFRYYLSRLDAQVIALERQALSLETIADRKEIAIESAGQLADWQSSRVDWANELMRFLGQVPDNKRVFLDRLRLEQTSGQLPEIRIEGQARTLDDVFDLNQRLLTQSPHYRLLPDSIDRNDQDPHYRVRFVVSAEVDPQEDTSQDVNVVRYDEQATDRSDPDEDSDL